MGGDGDSLLLLLVVLLLLGTAIVIALLPVGPHLLVTLLRSPFIQAAQLI